MNLQRIRDGSSLGYVLAWVEAKRRGTDGQHPSVLGADVGEADAGLSRAVADVLCLVSDGAVEFAASEDAATRASAYVLRAVRYVPVSRKPLRLLRRVHILWDVEVQAKGLVRCDDDLIARA